MYMRRYSYKKLAGSPLRRFEPSHASIMKLENAIRLLAGTLVLASLALAHWVHPNWVWLTVFVGFNLVQSALTGFCPAEIILKKFGIGNGSRTCCD
jgi:hypothetical protein